MHKERVNVLNKVEYTYVMNVAYSVILISINNFIIKALKKYI